MHLEITRRNGAHDDNKIGTPTSYYVNGKFKGFAVFCQFDDRNNLIEELGKDGGWSQLETDPVFGVIVKCEHMDSAFTRSYLNKIIKRAE